MLEGLKSIEKDVPPDSRTARSPPNTIGLKLLANCGTIPVRPGGNENIYLIFSLLPATGLIHSTDFCAPLILIHALGFGGKPVQEFHDLVV